MISRARSFKQSLSTFNRFGSPARYGNPKTLFLSVTSGLRTWQRILSCHQKLGNTPGVRDHDAMMGRAVNLQLVRLQNVRVGGSEIGKIIGRQDIRPTGDSGVQDPAIFIIRSRRNGRWVIRIVDRHAGFRAGGCSATQYHVGCGPARTALGKRADQRTEGRSVARLELQADQNVLEPGQHGVGNEKLHRPGMASSRLDGIQDRGGCGRPDRAATNA